MTNSFLLDTHTLIWATSSPDKLSPKAREVIQHPGSRILISTGTLWELAIKRSLGKITMPDAFFSEIFDCGYERLDIEIAHLEEYGNLPLIHRDPFDRLLVAQARAEDLVLIGSDVLIAKYPVRTLW